MNKPNFFIVGAPKCGTTAMNDYLSQHPDIFMAKKELHYFGADLKIKLRLSEPEYLGYFRDANNKKIMGEASVWYLFSKTAAEEIRKFSPEAKILIMLRNPVDVIYSLHSQHLWDGNEDIFDFKKAIDLDEERKKGISLAKALDFYEVPAYKDSVLFFEQVKRYLDVFGKENVHIIVYEDFVAYTKKTVAETLQFLKVSAEVEIRCEVVNPNKQIESLYVHRMLKNPSQRLKKMVRIILPFKRVRHSIMTWFFKWNTRIEKRTPMSDSLKKELRNFFADDINLLGGLVNKDLSAWLK